MANRIEILVEVDPTGRGQANIRKITTDIDSLGTKSRQAGQTGRDALDGFAGGLGVPTSIAASSAAIGAGIALVATTAIQKSNELANTQRILRSDAQEAGVEFRVAQAEARKFGDDLALTMQQADVSFARFLRVVKAAGELPGLERHQRNFENLAAAYGLTATEIETLTNQLLSGQDEALNRLGIADPSQLYIRYAESVGKTVEQLTEEEKVRARLLAVSEKGERFAGVAQERLVSQTGIWAQLSKNISDATTNLGDFLQKQTFVGTLPILIGGNPLTADIRYQEFLRKQSQAQTDAARQRAVADVDRFFKTQNESLGVPEALRDPFGSFQSRITLLGRENAEKERKAFISSYEAIFKDKNLDRITAEFAERQFLQIRGIFSPAKAVEIEQQFAKFWDKFAKPALSALRDARNAAEKNFDDLAQKYAGGANPFVKVLTEAEDNARRLERTFGVLGSKTVTELKKVEEAFTRQKLLGLQLDAELKAASLRREAFLLSSPTGLSGRESRELERLNAGISAAQNIPGLLAKADAIARGLVRLQEGQLDASGRRIDPKTELRYELDLNAEQIQKTILDELLGLQTFGRGEFGRRSNDAINRALVDLFESMSPELQARIATGRERGGSVFRDAFTGRAEEFRAAIRDEIEKAKVADRAVEFARQDIALILEKQRQGLAAADADRRLLAITGELAPNELTGDLRQARIEALRREADRTAKLEEEGRKAVEKSREATETLTKSIDALAAEIRKPQNRKLLVEIRNRARADVREELYGSLQQED